MTTEQFLQRHGAEWYQFRRSEAFPSLLEILRSFDPARTMPAVHADSATEHAQHLLGRIAGFNLAVNILETAIVFEPEVKEPEVTYQSEDENQ